MQTIRVIYRRIDILGWRVVQFWAVYKVLSNLCRLIHLSPLNQNLASAFLPAPNIQNFPSVQFSTRVNFSDEILITNLADLIFASLRNPVRIRVYNKNYVITFYTSNYSEKNGLEFNRDFRSEILFVFQTNLFPRILRTYYVNLNKIAKDAWRVNKRV